MRLMTGIKGFTAATATAALLAGPALAIDASSATGAATSATGSVGASVDSASAGLSGSTGASANTSTNTSNTTTASTGSGSGSSSTDTNANVGANVAASGSVSGDDSATTSGSLSGRTATNASTGTSGGLQIDGTTAGTTTAAGVSTAARTNLSDDVRAQTQAKLTAEAEGSEVRTRDDVMIGTIQDVAVDADGSQQVRVRLSDGMSDLSDTVILRLNADNQFNGALRLGMTQAEFASALSAQANGNARVNTN